MSARAVSPRERRRLRDVVREYKKRGYRVYVEPSTRDLPRFLRELEIRPDAVALSETDSVVIEVRSENSLANDQVLEHLARAVEDRPGWRFELVVTNPRSARPADVAHATASSEVEARASLRRAEDMLRRAAEISGEAAVSIWASTELSLGAIASSGRLQRKDVPALLKTLHSHGMYDADDLVSLEALYEIRSATVHGARPSARRDAMKTIWAAFEAAQRLNATAFFLPVVRDRLAKDPDFREMIIEKMRPEVHSSVLQHLPIGSDSTTNGSTQLDAVDLDTLDVGAVLDATHKAVWVSLSAEAHMSISYVVDPDYLEEVAEETLVIIEPEAAAYAAQVGVERAAYLEFDVMFDRDTASVTEIELRYAAPTD